MNWVLYAIIGVIVLGVLPTLLMSGIIYRTLLVRTEKEKWARGPSLPEDAEYMRLYDDALAWREKWMANRRDVGITNDGLRLCGEYYDFGGDRAVIVLSGRAEACFYGCHYAEPYRRAGWNVLTIDGRAHGLSEGKINSLGYREYRDVLAWAKYLHEREGNRRILLHGICIGSSTAVFAAADSRCPDYVAGLVADGMYRRFYDSFLNHMKMDHRPVFPFAIETMLWIRLFSRADAVFDGPMRRIGKVDRPILFLHSREDPFSTPDKVRQLYDRCPSANKRICWFDHGGHSKLRIANRAAYDGAIEAFLKSAALDG